MPFGGDGDKPPELKMVNSPFSRLGQAQFGGPFATGNTGFETYTVAGTGKGTGKPAVKRNRLTTSATLDPALQGAGQSASQGLANNLDYLSLNPAQRFAAITGGSDIFYNPLADALASQQNQALARTDVTARGRGLANSTTAGSAQAGILNDSLRRQREAMLQAYNLGTNAASTNAGTSIGALNSLNALATPLGSASLSALTQGRQFGDQFAAQQAQAKYNADMQNYMINRQNDAMMGGALGSFGSALGAIGGGLIGGPVGAQIGAGLGGLAGPLFGGSPAGISAGINSAMPGLGGILTLDRFGGQQAKGFI